MITSKIFIYGVYSFFLNTLFSLMDMFPHLIRSFLFRIVLKKIGRNSFVDYKAYFRYPSRISIGSNVTVNRDCSLYASHMVKNIEIIIGDNVAIGPHVRIYAATHDYSTYELSDRAASVIVEDYVWIGGGAIILPGVILGKGSVVGAGAVVAKNVPPFSVVAGNPARIINKRILQ